MPKAKLENLRFAFRPYYTTFQVVWKQKFYFISVFFRVNNNCSLPAGQHIYSSNSSRLFAFIIWLPS